MKKRSLSLYVILFTLVTLLAACAGSDSQNGQPADDGPAPTAIVTSPLEGEVLGVGKAVKVASTSQGERGIARVELTVNSQVIRVDANPNPEPDTPYLVAQSWTPETPGTYIIQVRAYNTVNVVGESEAVMVEVGKMSAQAVVTASAETTQPTTTSTTAALPTPTDRARPTQLADSATLTSPLAEPTPAPLGAYTPTGFEPKGSFAKIWDSLGSGDGQLGYPTAPEIDGRNFAYQYFDTGVMYWWDNPDAPDFIWVMASASKDDYWQGIAWKRYDDTWDDDGLYSCDAAQKNDENGPMRGFGKIWCQESDVFAQLGNPSKPEYGSSDSPPFSKVQFFQGGAMLYNPSGSEVFVLFNQGGWQRFPSY